MATQNQSESDRASARTRLAELAGSQHGVVTRSQALHLGLSDGQVDRLVASKVLIRLHSGVFRFSSSPPSWYQQMAAAVLLAGPEAVLSHRSAGAVLRLEGIPAGPVEITLRRRTSYKGIGVHFTQFLQPGDVVKVDNLLITSATRTLVDLGTVVNPDDLETALDDALRRGLTYIPRLRWALSLFSNRRHGMRVLTRLVQERDPKQRPTESILEIRLLRLIKKARLPAPVGQFEIKSGRKVIARVDFAYPELKLAIEADGYAPHSGKPRWQKDRSRSNALTSLGWSVIRVTSEDLTKRPEQIVALIRGLLGRQGELFRA